MDADMWTYKGWSINFDAKPINCRLFDWEAVPPVYDEETGIGRVHAATYEDLLMEIEDAIGDGECA